jgi:prepilin-type N-terminal cleavage/methylation domain-containing protein
MNKGFTLVELLIVVAVVGILSLVGLTLVGGLVGSNVDGDAAATNMTQYVQDLYPEYTSIRASCTNADTDGDGYVRCTATALDSKGVRITTPLTAECTGNISTNAWGVFVNEGCAPIKHGAGYGR